MIKVIGLIPCYNCEKECSQVILDALKYVDHLILVDDGSTDRTLLILKRLVEEHAQVFLIDFETNRGKGFALLEGIKKAIDLGFDVLVTLDADLQHLPVEIPKFEEAVLKGNDLVIGQREFKEMPIRSRFSNRVISFLLRRFYKHSPRDTQAGFRGLNYPFSKEVLARVRGGRYETEFEMILLALEERKKIAGIPITTIYAPHQISYFKYVRDAIRVLKVLYQHKRKESL